jgi:hypothetical protein
LTTYNPPANSEDFADQDDLMKEIELGESGYGKLWIVQADKTNSLCKFLRIGIFLFITCIFCETVDTLDLGPESQEESGSESEDEKDSKANYTLDQQTAEDEESKYFAHSLLFTKHSISIFECCSRNYSFQCH